jgi:hypothetical protein
MADRIFASVVNQKTVNHRSNSGVGAYCSSGK